MRKSEIKMLWMCLVALVFLVAAVVLLLIGAIIDNPTCSLCGLSSLATSIVFILFDNIRNPNTYTK